MLRALVEVEKYGCVLAIEYLIYGCVDNGGDDIYRDRGWLCFFLCLFMYVLVGVVYV